MMDKAAFIRQMAIGLLPLLVFIFVDEFIGTKEGLIVAIITGIAQLGYFYLKKKTIEKFVLVDTALIVALGGISLISHNDLFFKIKPGLIELILVIVLGISVFTPRNLIFAMQKRYLGDVKLEESQLDFMRKSLKLYFWIFLAHTVLVFYSAFYMSKEAWAFISTALFYIIMGLLVVAQLVMAKMKRPKVEWLPVLNEEGNVIGKAPREVCKKDKSLIYPVIRLHIFNSNGQIFLQKRLPNAATQPGKWDAAVAGHVVFGETIEQAVMRESMEELHISGFEFFPLEKRMFYGETTTAMIFIFGAVTDLEIRPDAKETAGGRFYNLYSVKNVVGEENLSAGFLQEYSLLIKLHKKIFKH